MQYLKHYRPFRDVPIFERFPVLICVTIVWIYSVILTAGGAYRHRPIRTQNNCRTDRANLISSAPWLSIWIRACSPIWHLVISWSCSQSNGIFHRFKFPYPLQWGAPTFDAGHTFAMMAAVLVSLIEVISIDAFLVPHIVLLTFFFCVAVNCCIQSCVTPCNCHPPSCLCFEPRYWLAG